MEVLVILIGVGLLLGVPVVTLICFIALFSRLGRQERRVRELEGQMGRLRADAQSGRSPASTVAEPGEASVELRVREALARRQTTPPTPPPFPDRPTPVRVTPLDSGDSPPRTVDEPVRDSASGAPNDASPTETREPVPVGALPEEMEAHPPSSPSDPDLETPSDGPLSEPPDLPIAASVSSAPEPPVAKVDLEVRLGHWLSRIGVGVIVIGVALFLAYKLPSLGGWGRVSAAAVSGLGMLGAGIFFQRKPDYLYLARGLMAGGWAILYSLAYAVHNFEPIRVVENPTAALFLLAFVATGMILHSLRHRAPAVTALTFVFAVLGMTVSPTPGPWVPVAVAVLGFAQLVVSRSEPYQRLGPLALGLTYAAQLFWLFRLDRPPADYFPWAILVQALVFAVGTGRIGEDVRAAHRAGWYTVLNIGAAFLLIVIPELPFGHPGPWMFPALLAGVALIDLGIRWNRDRSPLCAGYAVACVGLTTMVALLWALPAGWTQSLWLAIALGLAGAGVRLRAPGLGALSAFLMGGTLIWVLVVSLGLESDAIPLGPLKPAWTLLFAALALHGFHGVTRDHRLLHALGAIVALAGSSAAVIWVLREAPPTIGPVFLAIFAAATFGASRGLDDRIWWWHAAGLGLLSAAMAAGGHLESWRQALPWLESLPLTGTLWGLPAPLVWTFVPVALSYSLWWIGPPRLQAELSLDPLADLARGALAFAGLALVLLLLDTLCPVTILSVTWMVLGVVLARFLGPFTGRRLLREQGLLVTLLAGGHLFLANFTLTESVVTGISLRIVTILPVVIGLVHVREWLRSESSGTPVAERFHDASGFLVMAILAAFAAFELSSIMVAPAWALLGLGAIGLGTARRDRAVTLGGSALTALAAIRGITVQPLLGGEFFGIPVHVVATVPVMLALLLGGERLSRLRLSDDEDAFLERLRRRAPQVAPVLFNLFISTYLLRWVSGPWLTFAWSLQAAAVLTLGFVIGSRPQRWCALALIGLCLGKVFIHDLPELTEGFKILSFLALGVVMLGISFLYTRFRHKIAEHF